MLGQMHLRAVNVVKSPSCRKGFVEVRDAARRVPSAVGWISLIMAGGLHLPGGVVNSSEAAKEKASSYNACESGVKQDTGKSINYPGG